MLLVTSLHNIILVTISCMRSYCKEIFGVATIVQGAIVQGDSCPRRQLSKGQLSKEFLSKEIFVQVDSCPRRLLSKADFSPRRQLHVFLSKEELCFREGFKNIQRGGARFLKVCRYDQLHSKSCNNQLGWA